MKTLKKFWLGIAALFPMTSWALPGIVTGTLVTLAGLAGASMWRNISPVNTSEAYDFFTSCWTCQIFTDVMTSLSNVLPAIYSSLGRIVIPVTTGLLAVVIAWRLVSGFLNGKTEDGGKLLGNFGAYLVKLTLVVGLLLLPLPKIIGDVIITPAMTLGTSLNYIVADKNSFSECMVASAILDTTTATAQTAERGAFSPKLRHQLACEISSVHQVTGLGMTVGWTMLNMAFDSKYMYKILNGLPVFPNAQMALIGAAIIIIYLIALLPIPLYFFDIFVTLALDFAMLPLMLMSWMFDKDEFSLLPQGGRTIRQMLEDVFKGAVGIAITVVFLGFSVMFLNALFENFGGIDVLRKSFMNNDSQILMDALVLKDSSLLLVILSGIFIAMFMTMIPQLTNALFKVQISDDYYKKAKDNINTLWGDVKKLGSSIKK